MNRYPHLQAIGGIVRKDLHGLLPLVLLAAAVFLLQPLIASLDVLALGGDTEFWSAAQANFYWLGYGLGVLLMISVVQQDPASSLNHDWLTRPITRSDWLAAKLAFLVMTVALPVVLGRLLINLGEDYGVMRALADALALEKLAAILPVPLLFAVALLTPTLRKTISLLVMVLLVFLLPSWSVTSPLLDLLGIDLGSEFGNLMWPQALPILVAGLFASALVYALLYGRRQRLRACLAFSGCVVMVFLAVYPPSWLYNWDRAIALHQALINAPEETFADSVVLEPVQACFPAAVVGGGAGREQDAALLAQAAWPAPRLAAAGPGAITLATAIRSRDMLDQWIMPASRQQAMNVDWRVERIRTRAWYSAGSLDADIQLARSFTAENRFAPIADVETDYWLVPGAAVQPLMEDPTTRLTLAYDLALLAPTPHELATDGERRSLPGLGSCKAELDRNANVIEIDCLGVGARPALLSAELMGVASSRVDSATRASYSPGWVDALGRQHYEVSLGPASLVDSSHILLTAYNAKEVLHKRLVFDGMLGAVREICPLPGATRDARMQNSDWRDTSPHEVRSVAVEPGVRVEVLDWRGGADATAPTLILLPGLGATAHSYDQIAATLAERYNVVGMTRRGTGESSKPDHGYDIQRLGRDVLRVMDTLAIDSAVLVGHSIAGEELSYLGANHPERVRGLIYLDAAYDRVRNAPPNKRYSALNFNLPPAPPMRPAETVSYDALQGYSRRLGGGGKLPPEGEIMASYDLDSGAIRHDPLYLGAITAGLQSPDYPSITVPALAIYAMPGSPDALMESWYDQDDPKVQQAVAELYQLDRDPRQAQIARFDSEVPDSRVLIIENADHWIFVSHAQDVLEAMGPFIEKIE